MACLTFPVSAFVKLISLNQGQFVLLLLFELGKWNMPFCGAKQPASKEPNRRPSKIMYEKIWPISFKYRANTCPTSVMRRYRTYKKGA
jgi:hypothetical protein